MPPGLIIMSRKDYRDVGCHNERCIERVVAQGDARILKGRVVSAGIGRAVRNGSNKTLKLRRDVCKVGVYRQIVGQAILETHKGTVRADRALICFLAEVVAMVADVQILVSERYPSIAFSRQPSLRAGRYRECKMEAKDGQANNNRSGN